MLRHLVDALTEASSRVRSDAAAALEQMGGEESALLLRLKARAGDPEAQVTGQVFESLLRLEQDQAIPFVAGFLKSSDTQVCAEAALALGSSRLPEVLDILKQAWKETRDWRLKQVFLRGISALRQEPAIEFLLDLLKSGREGDAQGALEALAIHRDSPEIARRVKEVVEGKG
jgi:hypothetical protein